MDKCPDWGANWSQAAFEPLVGTSFFTQIFNVFVPEPADGATAIEIGCFPGRFIEYIGRKGYVISGIDTYPNVVQLNDILRQRGCKVGSFSRMDFKHLHSQFDLVISIGFIEHFNNWPEILVKHLACTKPGGRIIIGCPNFASPLQRAMHQAVDRPNLEQHVLPAMYPPLWGSFLRLAGIEPIYADNVGSFQFWVDTRYQQDSTTHALQQAFVEAEKWLTRIKGDFEKNESGYCLLVADKPLDWAADSGKMALLSGEFSKITDAFDRKDALLARQLLNAFNVILP